MSSIGMGQRKLAFSATVCSTKWPDKNGGVLLECGQTFRGVMVGVDCVWPERTSVWRHDVIRSPITVK